MAFRLLVNEDLQAKRLVAKLRLAGHDVVTTQESGLNGEPDSNVFEFAVKQFRVILTRNGADFRKLHHLEAGHFGIFTVHGHPDASKALSQDQIVMAIENLEASHVPVENEVHALESWNY